MKAVQPISSSLFSLSTEGYNQRSRYLPRALPKEHATLIKNMTAYDISFIAYTETCENLVFLSFDSCLSCSAA